MVGRSIGGYISYEKGIQTFLFSPSSSCNANTQTAIPIFSVRPGRVEAKAKADCMPIAPAFQI